MVAQLVEQENVHCLPVTLYIKKMPLGSALLRFQAKAKRSLLVALLFTVKKN
jgi:hypothetical protein